MRPWQIALIALLAAISGALLAIAINTAYVAGVGQWFRDFVKSPGAAGVAAVAAASIAYRGLSRQIAVSRAALSQQRDFAGAEAWWTIFRWASDRAMPENPANHGLPNSVTISTLQQLFETATSETQRAACSGIIDVLSSVIEQNAGPSPVDEPRLSQDDPGFAALESYVGASRGTNGASARAEFLVYYNDVLKALIALSLRNERLKIFRNPREKSAVDAVAEIDRKRVLIVVKAYSGVKQIHSRTEKVLRDLAAQQSTNDPVLLISPLPFRVREGTPVNRAVAVQWRGPQDTEALWAALLEASAL